MMETPPTPPAPPISQREYARLRGVSNVSVHRAIAKGRLKRCLVMVKGVAQIADPLLADFEWQQHTDLSRAPGSVKQRAGDAALPGLGGSVAPVTNGEGPAPTVAATDDRRLSLTQASAEEKHWKAKSAELDYRQRIGELVLARDVEDRIADTYARCRTKLLGVSSKAKSMLPHLSHADTLALDDLVREALEELAGPGATVQTSAQSVSEHETLSGVAS